MKTDTIIYSVLTFILVIAVGYIMSTGISRINASQELCEEKGGVFIYNRDTSVCLKKEVIL